MLKVDTWNFFIFQTLRSKCCSGRKGAKKTESPKVKKHLEFFWQNVKKFDFLKKI